MVGARRRVSCVGAACLSGLMVLGLAATADAATTAFGGATGQVASITGTSMEVQRQRPGRPPSLDGHHGVHQDGDPDGQRHHRW